MTERERLLDLLIKAQIEFSTGQIPDYLLANNVVVLPCKIGDKVYYINEGFIEPCSVQIIFLGDYIDKNGKQSYMAEIHFDREDCPYVSTEIYLTDIGKTVFLTKEEAEQTLEEMKKNEKFT